VPRLHRTDAFTVHSRVNARNGMCNASRTVLASSLWLAFLADERANRTARISFIESPFYVESNE
jgi:hypothetical protein